MAVSAVAGAVVIKAADWLFSRRKDRTETDANVELLNQLRAQQTTMGERIKVMEETQTAMNARLEQEILLRMTAQEEAHRLRLRVMTLEASLRGMGAVIPPEPNL
jgi:hypothetical protein